MDKKWKPIAGHLMFEVSDEGDVRRRAHVVEFEDGVRLQVASEPVKVYKSGNNMYVNLDESRVSVHRIVAGAFIENPEKHFFIRHKDGDKLNNRADNLEWSNEPGDSKQYQQTVRNMFGSGYGSRVEDLDTGDVFVSMKAAAEYYGFPYSKFVMSARGDFTFRYDGHLFRRDSKKPPTVYMK